jgi:hypothetical protein
MSLKRKEYTVDVCTKKAAIFFLAEGEGGNSRGG